MKQKSPLIIGIALLLLAAAIFFYSTQGKKKQGDSNQPLAAGTMQAGESPQAGGVAGTTTSSVSRDGDATMAALTEKYGDGRTKLSKKIALDMAGLMKDALELADLGAAMGGSASAKDLAIKQTTDALATRLKLTEEQKAEVKGIVEKRIENRIAAANDLAAALEKDPSAMMETILAGDAFKRGEITQEEYDATSKETLDSMKQVSGLALSGRGGSDLSDAVLADQLGPILNPDQQQQLGGIVDKAAEAPTNNTAQMPLQNGNLPAMELEKLDQAVVNAKKFTTGLKSVMEGVQGMKELTPPEQ